MGTRRDALRLGLGLGAGAMIGGRAGAVEPGRTGDRIGELGYVVTRDETILLDVAWHNDVGILELSAVNPGVDAWVPGGDRLIMLPTAHLLPDAPRTGLVINKAELRLYWFPKDGSIWSSAIGVGREGHDTPEGATTIVRKAKDPTWRPTENTRRDRPELAAEIGPGPENPLGSRAMYLGWPTYLIHGTNTPYGVGRRTSRGCIRMYPEAVERLYDVVPIGTRVTVVAQPIKVGWHEGQLWIEVHPDLGQLEELEESYSFKPQRVPASADQARALIEAKAQDMLARVDWRRVQAELVARRGIPVPVTLASGPTVPHIQRPQAATLPPSSARLPGRELPVQERPAQPPRGGAAGLY